MQDSDPQRQVGIIDHRIKLWLLVVSLATIGVLLAAALRENVFSDWHRLRSRYARLLGDKATDARGRDAAGQFEVRLVQNFIPDLGVVDRCLTCHSGVADPRMRDQPQPFTTHPGRYLEIHDPEKFGCTVCHQGQGRATEVEDAHGRSPFWDYPMLDASLVRTTCTRCHAAADLYGAKGLIAAAEGSDGVDGERLLVRGQRLLAERGCLGCHVMDGKGGNAGPDLSAEGEKTHHEFDFSHLGRHVPREPVVWLRRHFRDPEAVSPGTIMPAVVSGADAEGLTARVLAQRRKIPVRSAASRKPAPEVSGIELYGLYCSACHGADGRGSAVDAIRTPSLHNPDVLAVASDDYYRFIIARGRSNSNMPAWGEGHGNLSRDEIDRIVRYLRGWEPRPPLLREISASAGDAVRGQAYFRGLCAACHGIDGRGGIGNSLRSTTFLAVADDGFLARSIVNGRPGTAMPAWKRLSAQAVSDLLAYIRSWQPVPASFESVRAARRTVPKKRNVLIGEEIFASRCASCHGAGGIGPSLTSADFLRAVDDRYLYRAITQGRPSTAMPAWRHLSAPDIGAVLAYLRSFQKRPSFSLDAARLRGDWAAGEVAYRTSCARCHGEGGQGGVGPQLANPVFLDSVSDAALFRWIGYGRTGTAMKGFLPESQGPTLLRPRRIADVIAYVRHLGRQPERLIRRAGAGNYTLGRELFRGQCGSCHGSRGEGASGPQLNNPGFLETASDGYLAATMVLGRDGTAMRPMLHGRSGVGQLRVRNVPDVIAYMRSWAFPTKWRRTRNITEMSESSVTAGAQSFAHFCAGCHGPNGRGARDGEGFYAPALNNPEFLSAATDGFLLATIARGRRETPMRPFGKGAGGIVEVDSAQIDDIVAFIRSWAGEHASHKRRKNL